MKVELDSILICNALMSDGMLTEIRKKAQHIIKPSFYLDISKRLR